MGSDLLSLLKLLEGIEVTALITKPDKPFTELPPQILKYPIVSKISLYSLARIQADIHDGW